MVALNANVMIVCIAVKLSSERGSYVYSANSKYWKLQRILLLLQKLTVRGFQSAINHGHITYYLPNYNFRNCERFLYIVVTSPTNLFLLRLFL